MPLRLWGEVELLGPASQDARQGLGEQQLCAGVLTFIRAPSVFLLCPLPELNLQHTAGTIPNLLCLHAFNDQLY